MSAKIGPFAAFGPAAIGIVASAAAWLLRPALFAHAWLAAVALWVGVPLGSIGLLLIHALTGGRWGEAIRPQLRAGVATLPLLLPGLVPLLLMVRVLYPWADAGFALANRFYLNLPFFAARLAVYLAVWFALALLIGRRVRSGAALAPLAPGGLLALALSFHFFAIDLVLSLQPSFASSVFGMMAMAEAVLLALSVAILLRLLSAACDPACIDDLGRLLLALVVLWAYLDFMQLLIVWQSDLPAEAPWYLARLRGGWGWVAAAVAMLHLGLPFAALLSPALRASARGLAAVAFVLVLAELLRGWWLVLPAAHRGVSWVDAAAMLAVFGSGAGVAHRELARA